MISLTLRQLQYFDALARVGHFGRAAEACAVTQPALSMQIQELEDRLGVTLVERGRKYVTLTDHGHAVALKAARILTEVQDLVDTTRHHKSLTGRLRFGCIPTVAPYVLPALLPALRETYPGLELHLRETQTDILMRELSEAKLDVVMVALPVAGAEFDSMPLIEDKFVLAVPQSFDAKGQVVLTGDLLQVERLLLLEEGHCFRDQAMSYCSLQSSTTVNTMGASSFATIVRMVANGLGITLLPEMSLASEVRHTEIRLQRLPAPEPSRTIGLMWRRTSSRKSQFQELGQLIAGLQSKGTPSMG